MSGHRLFAWAVGAPPLEPAPPKKSRIERLLRWAIPHVDIGWRDIGEEFTRYTVASNRFFRVFIHQMHAPIAPPKCHDHPWSFVSLILTGGYWESSNGKDFTFYKPGSVLFRRAEFAHTVKTNPPEHSAWTLVITGPYRRQWQNKDCR